MLRNIMYCYCQSYSMSRRHFVFKYKTYYVFNTILCENAKCVTSVKYGVFHLKLEKEYDVKHM